MFEIFNILLFVTLFLIIKKKNTEMNFLSSTLFSIVILFVSNTLISLFMQLCNLNITEKSFNIIMFAFNIIMLIYIIKSREYQKYYIQKDDIISAIIIISLGLCISVKMYTTDLLPNYNTGDPVHHFITVKEFLNSGKLLFSTNTDVNYLYPNVSFANYPFSMYLNAGTFMRLFNKIDEIKMFVFFNISIWILVSLMFYFMIENVIEKLKYKNLTPVNVIFSIIFMVSYPLNLLIYGFLAQLFCVLFIISLIYIFYEYDGKLKKIYIVLLLSEIVLAYYYYIPESMLATIIIIIISDRFSFDKKQIINIIRNIGIIVIPVLVIAFIYLVYLTGNVATKSGGQLNSEGACFRDLYISFIYLIPLFFYGVFSTIKKRKVDFTDTLFISSLLFSIVLFILTLAHKSSTYYFYKNHVIIYLLFLIYVIKGSYLLYYENKKNFIINMAFLVTIFIFQILSPIINSFNKDLNVAKLNFGVFTDNYDFVRHNKVDITKEEKELAYNVSKFSNQDDRNNIGIASDVYQQIWFYAITKSFPKDTESGELYGKFVYKSWLKDEKSQYLVILKRNIEQQIYENKISEFDFDVILDYGNSLLIKKKENFDYKNFIPNNVSKVSEISNLNLNSNIQFAIDSIEKSNNEITIQGWGFIKNLEMSGSELYISLSKGNRIVYLGRSLAVNRQDVAIAFNKEYLSNSGFLFKSNVENIENGEYNLGIIIKKDGVFNFINTNHNVVI